jgi:hypothetical protein
MYSEKRVIIPTPEFYVLYNGIKPFPDKMVCRLSDSFAQSASSELALELIVTVYNVNKGYNEGIVKQSKNLHGYVTLVAKTREYERLGFKRAVALEMAIKDCIEHGILVEYLTSNASEVWNMLLQEWNMEDAKAVWQKEAEERGEELSDQKWKSIVADKDAKLADKDARLADKDARLADKDAILADKDAILADKDAEILRLRTQLEKQTGECN